MMGQDNSGFLADTDTIFFIGIFFYSQKIFLMLCSGNPKVLVLNYYFSYDCDTEFFHTTLFRFIW